ncbi:ABC transporter ATP-binding protein [Treponema sp. OMZ 787]|uniref:ABC transporter ATP-binding protein n=1 Tax=Treponema sp. OMZ 787 TaxID=2563669 RepID=UPI0020A4FBCC|nr:ABC transporter ATP-binding protein [Treponema sp. OMZ 787]UTC63297.1 ABC transporter ATP-binding protein [Treponema sp. OMZ 787]
MKTEKRDNQKRHNKGLNRRAFSLLFKKAPLFFISVLGEKVFTSLLPFIGIFFSARIVNELVLIYSGQGALSKIKSLVLLSLILTALCMLVSSLFKRWANYEGRSIDYKIEDIYVQKFLSMDFQDVESAKTNEIYTRIWQNANYGGWGLYKILWIYTKCSTHLTSVITSAALSISLFSFKVQTAELLFLNNPLFIFVILFSIVLLIIIPAKLQTMSDSYWAIVSEEATEGNRVVSFFFRLFNEKNRAMDVRMYGQQSEGNIIRYSSNIFLPGGRMSQYAKKEMGFFAFLSAFISTSLLIVIYGFVGLKALGEAFPAGNLMQYAASITALSSALTEIFTVAGEAKNNRAFLKDLFDFLDIKNGMCMNNTPLDYSGNAENTIEFKNVSFSYPDSEKRVLKNLNLTLKKNERLAVVGKNGSGKTTFVKLLCRLYDPTEGEILFNGRNIKEYDYKEYLNLFSVVFQDFKLLALPLAQNLSGGEAYDRPKVLDVLKKADLDLSKFKKEEETYLYKNFDDEGVNISGGEGQKIAIARALYKDAPFIILDEPTAALDPIAEAEIYSKFDGLVKNKTSLYISHRLSSCQFCSHILVFDEGRIVQEGSHEELLAEQGLYNKLWNAQAQYYQDKS